MSDSAFGVAGHSALALCGQTETTYDGIWRMAETEGGVGAVGEYNKVRNTWHIVSFGYEMRFVHRTSGIGTWKH